MKKRMLSAVLAAMMTLSLSATAFAADKYPDGTETMPISPKPDTTQTAPVSTGAPTDVPENAWYKTAVDYVLSYKLMDVSGTAGPAVTFDPDTSIPRQEVAEAIYRDAKLRDVADVGEDAGMSMKEKTDYAAITDTFLSGVSFCYYTGIMTGDANNKLNPQAAVTRDEMAAVLERYHKYLVKNSDDVDAGMAVQEFKDYETIQTWAHAPINFCIKTGMLSGMADGTFTPKGSVTRAQMAQILYNLEQAFVKSAPTGLKLITK